VGVRSKIAPLADDAISQEAFVTFVAIAKDHAIGYLSTNFREGAYCCVTSHFGSHIDCRALTKRKGTSYQSPFLNPCIFADINRSIFGIKDRSPYMSTLFNKDCRSIIGNRSRVANSLRGPSSGDQVEVRPQFLTIRMKDVPAFLYQGEISVIADSLSRPCQVYRKLLWLIQGKREQCCTMP